MKTFTTTLMAFLFVIAASAQVVVVNSPASIAGDKAFETPDDWGADLSSDTWTGDAEYVDDGTGADASQGCEALVNDLTGKIALIDRGTCEFGLKALNAENAGAIAAIIINNIPGDPPQGMAAGVNGGSVTIPVASLSYEDGQEIRAAIEAGETVNITMGLVVFDNDLVSGAMEVVVAPMGTYPISQLVQEGDFVVTPGATTINAGSNAAPGFTVDATITHTPVGGTATEVYNESASNMDEIPADSTAGIVALPPFDVFNTGEGDYTISYTVSNDNTDGTPNNNSFDVNFDISSNVYSKASYNEQTGLPNLTIYRAPAAGGSFEFLALYNIPYGQGLFIDTITCDVATNNESLAGVTVESFVYQWVDADEDGAVLNEEIIFSGFGTFDFPADFDSRFGVATMQVFNTVDIEPRVEILDNDASYFIGVRYTGDDPIFFGFDESYDYNQLQLLNDENGTFTIADYGYLLATTFDASTTNPDFSSLGLFTGVPGNASSVGISINPEIVSTEDVVGVDVFEMSVFPNPTSDVLTTKINFKQDTDFAEYRISDVNGSMIFFTRDNDVLGEEQATFNVKSLPAGQYYMTIRTEQGIQTTPFVVQH